MMDGGVAVAGSGGGQTFGLRLLFKPKTEGLTPEVPDRAGRSERHQSVESVSLAEGMCP